MRIINWDVYTGKNNFCGKTIEELIIKEFGKNRLEEIKNVKEFRNRTIFSQDHRFTPCSVLDKKSYYDWDSIVNGMGSHFIKIYLTPQAYFYCNNNKCYIEEDA